jgi:hypothetical protein
MRDTKTWRVCFFSVVIVGNNLRKGMFMVLWEMTRMCLLIMFCLEAGYLFQYIDWV